MTLRHTEITASLRAASQTAVLALCIAALASGGCYSTNIIPAQNLTRITIPRHRQELVLQDRDGRNVRIGPNSKIRFLVRGNRWTSWIRGRDLRVNRQGANASFRSRPATLVARWSDIFAAEVRNLHGGRTYGAVLATTILVGVVLLLLAGAAKGGGKGLGKGLGKAFKGAGRGLARGLARGALWHGFRLGVHLPRVHVSPGMPAPAPAPTPAPGPQPTGPDGAPPPPPPPGGAPASAPAAWTTPLPAFSSLVHRQSHVRFLGSVSAGTDLVTHDTVGAAAFVGFRAYDVIELSAGARLYHHRGTRTSAATSYRQSWMAVARIQAHLDLDQRRWVALPIGIDVGGGHAQIHLRLNLGIRIRLRPWLHLGIYPFNPTYTHFKDDTLKRDLSWWSFPSELELAFSF